MGSWMWDLKFFANKYWSYLGSIQMEFEGEMLYVPGVRLANLMAMRLLAQTASDRDRVKKFDTW